MLNELVWMINGIVWLTIWIEFCGYDLVKRVKHNGKR